MDESSELDRVSASQPSDSKELHADVEIFFAPEDRFEMRNEIFSFLDNAKNAVYVAMCWITDEALLNKLIELKKNGVDVQIFFDESIAKNIRYMQKLLNNGIYPIIYPSKSRKVGKMHNKFFIIDFKTVITGSANFTRAALDDASEYFNLENMVILHSQDVASSFLSQFIHIEIITFQTYVHVVRDNPLQNIPKWLNRLAPILFDKKPRLKHAVFRYLNSLPENEIENMQPKILNFFKDRTPTMTLPKEQSTSNVKRKRQGSETESAPQPKQQRTM
jgi:phosphatidylserine/phosphatidylglycerophosphate/cardiolipin synthase-like enzyme